MIIRVLVELSSFNIDKTFSYHVKDDLIDKIQIGIRVLVPFGKQIVEGFVLEKLADNNGIDELKDIIEVVDDEPILNDELLDLGKYISDKYLATLISSYQVMLPKALKASKKKSVGVVYDTFVEINESFKDIKLTDKQMIIYDLLCNRKHVLYQDLKKINSSVDTLIKNGILKKVTEEKYRYQYDKNELEEKKILTFDQQKISDIVTNNLNKYMTYLLYGVTGSGKTEVYMEIMSEVIKRGQKAILLVPEITLASQILKRFCKRFSKIAVLHSALSDGEKYDEYRRIKKGEVDIVIGARSAIFAPLSNIGVIIMDECHASTYQQDSMPRYDTFDIASYRAKKHNCPVILGSATPTIEQFIRAKKGLFQLLVLDKRVGKRMLPDVLICDMTKEERVKKTSFSNSLYVKILECLEKNEQVILLINRRGYSNSLTCKNCGYTYKCPHCEISLTYHKNKDLLRCHYCGYAINRNSICLNCHEDSLHELGSGTEKIEEELKKLFENAKILRMDLDTTSKKGSHDKMINDFMNHKYDILLGTQMIAKGLDFPNVTLVGVINADTNLFMPSYKSAENTFQLLNQVAGRSGRGEKKGEVIIQTYNPDHYAIRCASNNNYLAFFEEEMQNRLVSCFPPYFYLVHIIIKAKDYELVSRESNRIVNILKSRLSNSSILGPTTCLPFKINNICRFGILIKYKKEDNLYIVLKELIDHYKGNNNIRLDINFNPSNI